MAPGVWCPSERVRGRMAGRQPPEKNEKQKTPIGTQGVRVWTFPSAQLIMTVQIAHHVRSFQ